MSQWYKQSTDQVADHLKTDILAGLWEGEAQLRLSQFGPNEMTEAGRTPLFRIMLRQFSSTVVLVLIISTAISAALGDIKNALTIAAIVILNALLGFTQEHKAEEALSALKKLNVPIVKVKRDRRIHEIPARNLVPGDCVIIEAGGAVPADGRIVESVNLRIQESALTGESTSVEKQVDMLDQDRPLAERSNMAYAGTLVTYGRGLLLVSETGMRTELGRIAAMLQSVSEDPTPFQKRLDQLGTRLALVALLIVGIIFGLGLIRGEEFKLMFMTAVSIAVAAVPEGLPAIVTINLAFGAQRLLKQQALIRRLPAVETLGSVTVICTDKTGTLTENRMRVTFIDVADYQIDLKDVARGNARLILTENSRAKDAVDLLLIGCGLCNDVILSIETGNPDSIKTLGEPTEAALALVAAQYGFPKVELEKDFPRIWEFPFDPFRKRMSTLHRIDKDFPVPGIKESFYTLFTKGSVDSLLSISAEIFVNGEVQELNSEWKKRIRENELALARAGLRVMAVAHRPLTQEINPTKIDDSIETNLIFIGLVGLQDSLRPEVKDAVQVCRSAGIKPVMITGDHPSTAEAIAKDLEFVNCTPVTGLQLERLSPNELETLVDNTSVYARVSPQHKLDIVRALQKRGHVVAMTGDGVNDAPALKKADIGVAMGITGTDAAKESADMILLDDNFATIVAAVKEGRVIYENIRKFLRYLLTGNVGEIWLMFLAPLIGMPLPLLPVQILWMNLITDGIPALALGMEPAGRNIMNRPPIDPAENIFGRGLGGQIVRLGFVVGLVPLAIGAWYWHHGSPLWRTMMFVTLILLHVQLALAFRSQHDSFFHRPIFSNKPLLGTVILSVLLQLIIVYTPFLQPFFETLSLPLKDLAICLLFSTTVFWLVEIEKWFKKRRTL